MKRVWQIVKTTISEFFKDKCMRLAAAVAYHTVFSLAPTMVIVIAVVGIAFHDTGAQKRGQVYEQISSLIGQQSADAVYDMMQSASQPKRSIWATVIGVALLIASATAVFVELQDSLNVVFEVETKSSSGIWGFVRDRLLSFALILAIGFLLLVSLALNAGIAILYDAFEAILPAGLGVFVFVTELLITLGVISLLFTLMFKFLPDARISWRSAASGAAVTAVLFTIGRTLIGLYLGNSEIATTYGSAAAIVIILLWVYYSSIILFVGAEFTQIYAKQYGGGIVPHGRRIDRSDPDKKKSHKGK